MSRTIRKDDLIVLRLTGETGSWWINYAHSLGEPGGSGTVYSGTNEGGDMKVAIKVLNGPEAKKTGKREFKIDRILANRPDLAELREYVIPIYDLGYDQNGVEFIVMAYARDSLQNMIKKGGESVPERTSQYKPGDILRMLLGVCEGIRLLHGVNRRAKQSPGESQRIIHRDLKPANILYDAGKLKLADFGLAKEVETPVGASTVREYCTPDYVAPEFWKGDTLDWRSDIYSLGCVVWCVLFGESPFGKMTRAEIMAWHSDERNRIEFDRIKGSGLQTLVRKMLEKAPDQRPEINFVIEALKAVLDAADCS